MTTRALVIAKPDLTAMPLPALRAYAKKLEDESYRVRAELRYVERTDSHNAVERNRLKAEAQEISDELMDVDTEIRFKQREEIRAKDVPDYFDMARAIAFSTRQITQGHYRSMR